MASKVEKQELAEEFIKIWKVEPSLWDVKSSLYKDRNAKARSFARFKDMLGMNEKECKSKINTLRSYFVAELKRVESTNNESDAYKSKWTHFKSLMFLRDTVQSKRTIVSFVDIHGKDRDDEEKCEGDDKETISIRQDVSPKFSQHTREELSRSEHVTDEATIIQPIQRNNYDRKRQRTKSNENDDISLLSSKKAKADADELFGRSIGASLKLIPDHRSKEFVKVKIQELVYQAQFGLLTDT